MTIETTTTVRVIVKLRDLDTDARTVIEHDVAPPHNSSEVRARLIEAVAQHKPDAEIRSFANHAASFVDSEHLIVAYFERPGEIRKALRELARQDGQGELFPDHPGGRGIELISDAPDALRDQSGSLNRG